MVHESSYYDSSIMVTLTYNNENLPVGNTLVKEDVVLWMKRYRKEKDVKGLKYYLAGEYGEKNRPHYHVILFGSSYKDRSIINETWNKGFVYLSPFDPVRAAYVAAYVQKKLNGAMAREVYGNRLAPFALMSKGIGKRWALDNNAQLNEFKTITIKGKPMGVPRYYTKISDIDLGQLPEYWADGIGVNAMNDNAIARREWLDANCDPLKEWEAVKAKRIQDDETINQKLSMKKRR